MSVQAKYAWAVGLIIAGVIGALPFRNPHSVTQQPLTKAADHTSQVAGELERKPDQERDSGHHGGSGKSNSNGNIVRPLARSHLLPGKGHLKEQGKLIEQYDQHEEFAVRNLQKSKTPVLEQVPRKLDKGQLSIANSQRSNPRQKSILQDADPGPNSNPTAPEVGPAGDPANQVQRTMPHGIGPYRMKPVSRSRVRSASQSRPGHEVTNVSRNREVIQYRLRDGDTLRSVARRYLGDASRYEEILADNRHLLTNGENFLPVGQYITIIIQ